MPNTRESLLSPCYLSSVSGSDIILGLPWLQQVNPLVPNWSTGDLFITRRKVNGKIDTYKCRSIPSEPFKVPENCPSPYSRPIINKDLTNDTAVSIARDIDTPKDDHTRLYWVWISLSTVPEYSPKSRKLGTVNSLPMQEAVRQATAYAEQGEEFYQPAFEEPPLYKESTPQHTPQRSKSVLIDL